VNAFFITSTGNTTPTNNSATLKVADMQARYQTDSMSPLSVSTANGGGAGKSSDRGPLAIPNLQEELKVYPNPASVMANLHYRSSEQKQLPVKVVNMAGVVCFESNFEVKAGVNVLLLDLKKVSAGLYIIQAGTKTAKLIVQ
jgi:hypothetical protein